MLTFVDVDQGRRQPIRRRLSFRRTVTTDVTQHRQVHVSVTIQHVIGRERDQVSGWQEMAFGKFDGVPFAQLQQEWPQLEAFWQSPARNTLPQAESLESFYQRVSEQWQALIEQNEQDTLIVCHGGTIRMILAHVLKLDWQNPLLYSSLAIGHQSITHIQISLADQHYFRVCSIAKPLAT